MSMKFRTPFSDRTRFYSPRGSRFLEKYIMGITEKGEPTLVKTGTEDVYDSIQKASNGILVEDLVRRARLGDDTAIGTVVQTGDVDLTRMPKDMLEAHSMLSDAKSQFMSLPLDVRSKFDNSFDKFVKASVDGSAVSIITDNKKQASPSSSSLTASDIAKLKEIIGGSTNA